MPDVEHELYSGVKTSGAGRVVDADPSTLPASLADTKRTVVSICSGFGGRRHIYVNPYFASEHIASAHLRCGDVFHVFTESGLHQTNHVTQRSRVKSVAKTMGWSVPAHQTPSPTYPAPDYSKQDIYQI